MSEAWLITIHTGPVQFVRRAADQCEEDFRRFARSRGFLLFEIGAALRRSLHAASRVATDHVTQLCDELVGQPGEEVFGRVAAAVREVLRLRTLASQAAEVMSDLATRRSVVVPESTQPHLQALATAFERLAMDLAVQREILNDAVQMYLGAEGQRTNCVIQRLTIVGMIFLPLTFLAGVYGMNMFILESQWKRMYVAFWAICIVVVLGLLHVMRRTSGGSSVFTVRISWFSSLPDNAVV